MAAWARFLRDHPYRSTFVCALRLGLLRAAWVKLLAGATEYAPLALLAAMTTEWIMSRTTSRAVGHRVDQRHLPHIDDYWATGAALGLLCGVLLVHVAFHVGREDPLGCLLNWSPIGVR